MRPAIIPIESLRPNAFNVNIVPPELQAKLEASVRRFGMFKPILVREVPIGGGAVELEILGGEHRWIAAKSVGLTEVPIVNLGLVSDERAKEIMLVDNQRYGADDTLALANLMKEIGISVEEFDSFLPFTSADIASIFSSTNIALDDLDLGDLDKLDAETSPEPKVAKAPKTHTVMKFKVPVKDAERITEVLTKLQARHGYTASDELTNAGDALVHLVFAEAGLS